MNREIALLQASLARNILPREKALHLFNPHFLRYVEVPQSVELFTVPAEFLLNPKRFDIVAKSIYGRLILAGIDCRWGETLYTEHIWAFNKFREDDGNKNSYEDFVTGFHSILESVGEHGFDDSISVVPIGANNEVVDGSHRVAAALVHGKTVTVTRFPGISINYDHNFFRNRGMGSSFMDATALEFCRLNTGSRIFLIWPSAGGNYDGVQSILTSHGTILYCKEVCLRERGALNLVRHIYEDEPWLGDYDNGLEGGLRKVQQCFRFKIPLRVFLVGEMDEALSKRAKEEIRELFGIGNDSVHSADSHEESLELAKYLFNDNSIHLLNNMPIKRADRLHRLLDVFRQMLVEVESSSDLFCIDTGAVLAAYGLRDPSDLDFLSCSEQTIGHSDEVSNHDSQLCYHRQTKEEIIFDPRNHFFLKGIKFASLRVVRDMKETRSEPKDWDDILLIDRLLGVSPIRILVRRTMLIGKRALHGWGRTVRRKANNAGRIIADQFVPFIRTIRYCGYDVYYSKGNSLIKRIHDEGAYERETCHAIVKELGKWEDPVFLDVGANIGLISLNVLDKVPGVVIHAFEPGAYQYELFSRTIKKNSLEPRIILHREALGEVIGERSFSIHDPRHASGDGFLDTDRAGEAKTTKVCVTTIDAWADRFGVSPEVIKIDTEGAELWVLQGGENYIRKKKPVIFVEISMKNLHAYPYSHDDIVRWLQDLGYRLFTISGIPLDEANIVGYMDKEDTFIARYR